MPSLEDEFWKPFSWFAVAFMKGYTADELDRDYNSRVLIVRVGSLLLEFTAALPNKEL